MVIVVPRKKDCPNSTTVMNKIIQDELLPASEHKEHIDYGTKTFRIGSKVIQRENNYDKNVVNGETGYVTSIFEDSEGDERTQCFTVEYSSGGDKKLITESLDIFKTQQRLAHEAGLKTTIQMTYASLFNDEAVELAKQDHEKYGDEIALSLLGLPCEEFREKYKTKDFCIWMFSMEDKKAIVNDVFEKFHDRFGFYPESTGSYYMDADLTNYIKEKYPMVKCAVATCWEEGPKAYHTCNNSWYTLFD